MNFGLGFAAAFGVAGFMALCAPASATTFTYDLAGDTATTYSLPGNPQWSFIDLTDATSGSSTFSGYTLNVGDTVHLTLTLNNPISFTDYTVWVQEASATSMINFNPTYSYFLGGAAAPVPGSNWSNTTGSGGGLAFGSGYTLWGTDTFSFDKVIVDAVITSMTDSSVPVTSLHIAEGFAGISIFNLYPPVATTPIPGALLLMTTALGGLGFVARRKRVLSA